MVRQSPPPTCLTSVPVSQKSLYHKTTVLVPPSKRLFVNATTRLPRFLCQNRTQPQTWLLQKVQIACRDSGAIAFRPSYPHSLCPQNLKSPQLQKLCQHHQHLRPPPLPLPQPLTLLHPPSHLLLPTPRPLLIPLEPLLRPWMTALRLLPTVSPNLPSGCRTNITTPCHTSITARGNLARLVPRLVQTPFPHAAARVSTIS